MMKIEIYYCLLAATTAASTVEGLSSLTQPFERSRAGLLGSIHPTTDSLLTDPTAFDNQRKEKYIGLQQPLQQYIRKGQGTASRRQALAKAATFGAFCGWILAPNLRPALAAFDDASFAEGTTITAPTGYNLADAADN